MPDFQVTDQLDKPVDSVKIDLTHPSSLVKYCRNEVLHLAVSPDFLERKDLVLTQAASKPIQFQAKAEQKFSIGKVIPSISITPETSATIRVNATPKSNLFEGDSFHAPARTPDATGYVSVGFEGSFDASVSETDGDISFGFEKTSGVSIEYLKAFPLGPGEPALGAALGQTMSSFVIPAELSDVTQLGINDIATVSGNGSLRVSCGVKVTAAPNPLASASLPLGLGNVSVKAGVAAGLSASFTITGSYQLRVRRTSADTFELGFYRENGTAWKADISASGGISATAASKDIVSTVLGAISTDPAGDKQLFEDLKPAEMSKLHDAINSGVDHSLQASVDTTLSACTDDEAAFQYQIQPALLSGDARKAVEAAFTGDLTQITAMEGTMESAGKLAEGLTMLNSLLTETRKRGVTLKINLIGILNYLTVSELIRKSEVLTEEASGDVTIKETVTGNSITAVTDPLERAEALRKAIFESVLATTTYKAGKAVAMPELNCEQMHFALHRHTDRRIMGDYLRWFAALNIISSAERQEILSTFAKADTSTCVLRTSFSDHDCSAMFFDGAGNLRPKIYYLDFGRQAMRAMLDPENQPIDKYRYRIVDDELWQNALIHIGANVNLGPLVGLETNDPNVNVLISDVKRITDWAGAMVDVGVLVQQVRTLVGNTDPVKLVKNDEFNRRRGDLQKKLGNLLSASKEQFDTPWGMVCLYWAGGSPRTSYGKTIAGQFTLERGTKPAAITAGTG